MVQFLSINFFSWISSIFVGFFKSSRIFVSPCINTLHKGDKDDDDNKLKSIQMLTQERHLQYIHKLVSGNEGQLRRVYLEL